jgi:hypothetical protein
MPRLAGREKDTRVDGMNSLEGERFLVWGDVAAACDRLPTGGD